MSTISELTIPVAVLLLPVPNLALLAYAKAVYKAMLDNPSFPSPNPPLAVFAANIAAFEEAEMNASMRTKGAASFRDVKKQRLKGDLHHLQDYVQSVVETSMSFAEGAAVIESANMRVKKARQYVTHELSAKNTEVLGKVVLRAKPVAPSAVYVWEYSADQSSWTSLPETMRCRVELSGLMSGCVYHFRFRAFTRAGWRDYSQVVSLRLY